jgi:carboxylesterase type B
LPDDFRYDGERRRYSHWGNICPQPTNFNFLAGIENEKTMPETPLAEYSEDCLTLNIWVPGSMPPAQGFPVLFYIHGGWLQVGNANHDVVKDPTDLLASHEEGGKGLGVIVVAPAYRLNVFGFLAMDCMPEGQRGNFGFWDQRLALEWTVKHIAAFKGDPHNITIGGLSAGAHSAHSQALYEFMRTRDMADGKPLFRRLFMQSNAAMIPAKTLEEIRPQVSELLEALKLGHLDQSSPETLEALRKLDARTLVDVLPTLDLHTFRAVRGHGEFVDPSWSRNMLNGEFARWCKKHDIAFVIGETINEENVYSLVNTPTVAAAEQRKATMKDELTRQVQNYYSQTATSELMNAYTLPTDASSDEWRKTFGMITADSQVYAAERTLVELLVEGGLDDGQHIFRYQIGYRARYLDAYTPAWMGVSHGFDDALWWFARPLLVQPYAGSKEEFDGAQMLDIIRFWLYPFAQFLRGADIKSVARLWYNRQAGSQDAKHGMLLRRLMPTAQIVVAKDERWKEKKEVIACIRRLMEQASGDSALDRWTKDVLDTLK